MAIAIDICWTGGISIFGKRREGLISCRYMIISCDVCQNIGVMLRGPLAVIAAVLSVVVTASNSRRISPVDLSSCWMEYHLCNICKWTQDTSLRILWLLISTEIKAGRDLLPFVKQSWSFWGWSKRHKLRKSELSQAVMDVIILNFIIIFSYSSHSNPLCTLKIWEISTRIEWTKLKAKGRWYRAH